MPKKYPVAIVSDSSISLPQHLVDKYQMFLAPVQLTLGDVTYQDGIDISPDQFYRLLKNSPFVPKTAGVSPQSFQNVFDKASKIADCLICITMAEELSSTYHAAVVAANNAKTTSKGTDIYVVDSRTAGIAQGLIALEAGAACLRKSTANQTLELIKTVSSEVKFVGFLETIEYLRRSGRVSSFQWFLASLIRTKPMLELSNGVISPIARPRTTKKAIHKLFSVMENALGDSPCRIAIAHADSYTDAVHLYQLIENNFDCKDLFITDFTPVIGAHTGPGLLGCAFFKY